MNFHRAVLITGMGLAAIGGRRAEAAYEWLFATMPGQLTVVSDEFQGSTTDYDRYRIVIKPPGIGVEDIPMLLCLPKNSQPPFPAVVLLHGHGGSKEGPVGQFAPALAQIGAASLAYDMPDHGERSGGNGTFWDPGVSWDRRIAGVNLSVTDGRWAVEYLSGRGDIDSEKTAVMGVSLGSYIGCILADMETSLGGLVMNVGGTDVALEQYIRNEYGEDFWNCCAGGYFPTTHAPDIAPRPVWMLNGGNDTTVGRDDAEALFEACREPRRITWYDSGHSLPPTAVGEAVGYLHALFTSPGDLDGDGLANDEEISTHFTRPLVSDSDGDGLSDGAEVNLYSTDPLAGDTDDDGMADYDEVNYDGDAGYNPYDPVGNPGGTDTNASGADTDGDLFSDLLEIVSGSDPLNDTSMPGAVKINFQPGAGGSPAGYVGDSGGGHSTARGYGWR